MSCWQRWRTARDGCGSICVASRRHPGRSLDTVKEGERGGIPRQRRQFAQLLADGRHRLAAKAYPRRPARGASLMQRRSTAEEDPSMTTTDVQPATDSAGEVAQAFARTLTADQRTLL